MALFQWLPSICTPAPKYTGTCAKIHGHLRQKNVVRSSWHTRTLIFGKTRLGITHFYFLLSHITPCLANPKCAERPHPVLRHSVAHLPASRITGCGNQAGWGRWAVAFHGSLRLSPNSRTGTRLGEGYRALFCRVRCTDG